jgi:hypothetical protein
MKYLIDFAAVFRFTRPTDSVYLIFYASKQYTSMYTWKLETKTLLKRRKNNKKYYLQQMEILFP